MSSTTKRKVNTTIQRLEKEYEHEPALVNALSYLRAATDKRPKSMIARYGRYSANYLPTLKEPYTTAHLDRFEDCFRSDGVAQRGIIKRTQLVLGKSGRLVLDTTEEYETEDERKEALDTINANTTYQEAKKTIQKLHVKKDISFHSNLTSAVINAKTYGRATIEQVKQSNNENGVPLPGALHVLNSKRLGRVEVTKDWEFVGVHYLDLLKGPSNDEDLLEADDIIYFANKDYHISPGGLYYGLSDLEPIVDGSEAKRIGKQEDIKEIMKSNWAPYLIIKFLNPNITTQQMQEVVSKMLPGVPFGTKQDIEPVMESMAGDLKKITECIDFLNRETLRDLGIPAFIGGYEQIANYANSQQILLQLKELEFHFERLWVSNIIEPQWLNKLFYPLIGLDPDAPDFDPEVKLTYVSEDINFETTLDRVNAHLPLFDRDLISGEKILKIADAEDEIEEYQTRRKVKEQEKERQLEISLRQTDIAEQKARDQISTTYQKRQASQSLYKKFEEKLEDLT